MKGEGFLTYIRRRKGRSLVGLLALLGLLIGIVVTVIPGAIGGTAALVPIPPETHPENVTPSVVNVGGSNFSCLTQDADVPGLKQAPYISKAVTGTYTDPATGVTFTIKNPPDNAPIGDGAGQISLKEAKNYFSFSVSGGKVYDVGVNGGSGTAWYHYEGGVKSDGTGDYWPGSATYPAGLHALHATRDSKNNLYVASITTFCYIPTYVTIKGTVFKDTNEDQSVGKTNGIVNSPDAALPGWTVTLFRDGVSLGTATADANGYYEFANVLATGTGFKLCETAPSGSWFQTTPPANTCSSPLARGFTFAPDSVQPTSTYDFGNVPVVTSTCGNTVSYPTSSGTYEVRLAGTTGKCNGQYVLLTYLDPSGKQVAKLHQVQSTTSRVEVVEKIVWSGYSPTTTSVPVVYDDSFGNPLTKTPMLFCKYDPRKVQSGVRSEFELGTTTTGVLPDGVTNDPTADYGSHTSCLISAKLEAPATSTSTTGLVFTAYVYSSVDGYRGDG